MMDPVCALLIVSCAMLLFGAAAVHKLRALGEFAQALAQYQLLPAAFIRITGPALGLMELAICLGLPWPALRSVGAAAGAVLLLMYAAAITINLARGRRDLDCGCGGFGRRTPIGSWMVVRNLSLACTLCLLMLPEVSRGLGSVDAVTIAGGVMAASFLYLSCDVLFGQVTARRLGSTGRS
jgi:Methylamine utilisation protein MauE